MRRKKLYASVLACLMLGPTAALAQEVDEFTLDPVIVTATRTERGAKEISAAVQVITREDMDNTGATNLADALSMMTGGQIVKNSGSGKKSVAIRGFDSRFSTILVNGRRIASEPDQLFELNRLPLTNIERIEIVRGPQSALYGTEALGGVVNIITRNSKDQSVMLSLGQGFYGHDSANAQNYDFSYQSGQTGRFRYSVYASLRENDAVYKSNGYTYEPYGQHKNFGASIEYDLSKTEVLTLDLSYEEERTNEIAFRAPSGIYRRTLDDNRRNEQSLSYRRKTENTEVFFRYYQGVLNKAVNQLNHTTGNLMNPGSIANPAVATWVRAERTMRALEGRLVRRLGDRHTLTIGAEYRPEKFAGTGVNTGEGLFGFTANGVTKQASTARLNYFGMYVQDEWQVSPKFKAITALRFDDNNKFGNDFSPKLGLIYQFDDTSRLKVNAAKAFRSPTPNQLYGNVNTQLGNPNLKSEKSKSYDISYEKDFRRSGYKLTYFYNDVDNLIDLRATGVGADRMYHNIAKATIQGVEAEYTTRFNEHWSWINSYTYLDATDDMTGTRLRNRAKNMFSSRISYDDKKNFTASLWADLYHDYLPADDAVSLRPRSYALWNLAASYKLNKNTKVILGLYNMFDKQDEDTGEIGQYFHATLQFKF